MKMNKKMIPAAIAASVVGFAGVLPNVYAGDVSGETTEQRAATAEVTLKDAWLDGKLETALLFNEHLNSFAIDTDVKHGIAYLSGSVESDIDRDLAGQIAKSIEGVSDVKNELTVDASKARAAEASESAIERQGFKESVLNATLTARVKSQLLINTNTDGLSMDVDSENGVVTLSGMVKSSQESDLAEKIAENTEGTHAVVNRLSVEPPEEAE